MKNVPNADSLAPAACGRLPRAPPNREARCVPLTQLGKKEEIQQSETYSLISVFALFDFDQFCILECQGLHELIGPKIVCPPVDGHEHAS